jgi:glutamine cyclotransferase
VVWAASACACDGCARVAEPSQVPGEARPAGEAATATGDLPPVAPAPARTTVPTLVARRPHDEGAFTQGLLFADGAFFESTGLYGESSLRRVDPDSGRVTKSVALPQSVFGEGLALLHGELFQLTWREHRCFVYDAATFEKRREATYEGEGWGLTTDGERLVMSDGSAVLRFLDPASFAVVRTLEVRDGSRPLSRLNELEWIKAELLANVWGTSLVARIDPRSGAVRELLDLGGLPEPSHGDDVDAVLNGIAYDEARDRLFVTGKRWGSVFEIRR